MFILSHISNLLKTFEYKKKPLRGVPKAIVKQYPLYNTISLANSSEHRQWNWMESNRLTNKNPKRPYSGPALITISINIEGISPNNIVNGFENKPITGLAFVDLSAAYGTVKHIIMLPKLYEMTHDYHAIFGLTVWCIVKNISARRKFVRFSVSILYNT